MRGCGPALRAIDSWWFPDGVCIARQITLPPKRTAYRRRAPAFPRDDEIGIAASCGRSERAPNGVQAATEPDVTQHGRADRGPHYFLLL